MTESIPGAKRLKGELPAGTVVAHKTGTGGTRNGITSPTNDIGIIPVADTWLCCIRLRFRRRRWHQAPGLSPN
jgi:hypothetical protein